MVTISTDGEGALAVGSAVAIAGRSLGGVIRFSIPDIGIAGVGQSEPLSGFIVPVRRKVGGINTGIAVHNTGEQDVALKLALRQAGQEIAASIEDLPGGGHSARFIDELFPDANTDDLRGTLLAEISNGKVAATALELGPKAGQFTTLPVMPLKREWQPSAYCSLG